MGVSTPSGDVAGAEEAVALCTAFLPPEAEPERVDCSTPGHAPDLVGRLRGSGARRWCCVGHLDTVVAHDAHRPLAREGDRLIGSGTVDMKGGVALALGVMRELAQRPELYAEVAVLLVNDEEWRTVPFAHTERFAGFDACLCFEAGEVDADGNDAVIVAPQGGRARCGWRPTAGRRTPARRRTGAAARCWRSRTVARRVAERSDPAGPDRLTAVPTILRSGEAFNVVPPHGELVCDLRADGLAAFQPVLDAVPERARRGARSSPHWCAPGRAWTRAPRPPSCSTGATPAGAPAGGLRARRRQRREPHRDRDPAHGRRPGAARRGRPRAARVGQRRSLRTRAEVALARRGRPARADVDPVGSLSGRLGQAADTLRRTPLFERHQRAGAKLVPFAGWDMPVQYEGIRAEHVQVRTRGGHVRRLAHGPDRDLAAPDAERFLQRLLSNDVAKLAERRRPVLRALPRGRRRARRPVHLPARRATAS